ncbi:MAG: helix-turn-helix domain-containing protein [Kiritimatiellae bacterium]|nr:helix-turn-helix domain-containing protein [Kiritimatiellia bacterium]
MQKIGLTIPRAGRPPLARRASPHAIETAFRGLAQLPDVRFMGSMIFDPIWSQKRHASRGSCELIHIIKGTVQLELPRGRLTGRPGDTLMIPSNTLHRDNFNTVAGLKVFMVQFTWVAESDYFAIVKPLALPIANTRVAEDIARLFDRLHAGLDFGTEADHLLVCSQVHSILLMILREALCNAQKHGAKEKNAYGERHRQLLMLRARQYLDEHFAEPVSLDQLARMLNVSPFYLSHIFSRESDFSLFTYLTNLRMQRSRTLLLKGAVNVTEAAHAVGYEDEGYFSKVFRKYFGVPPRDMRD